ncbi:MAG: LytR/AlgR family response regulator transcription factor [Flammeovirgaceae bacterium]
MSTEPLNCLAIDDEPFALKLLADDIQKIDFLKLKSTCASVKQAKSILAESKIDLLFLDIQMPEITGIQFLRESSTLPMVILTTAYHEYALDGFELEVIDYLMKPIPFNRLERAAAKAREHYNYRVSRTMEQIPQYLFVYSEYKEQRIVLDDILYIEGLKDYVKIFLATQAKPIMTRMNLKAIEKRLTTGVFCRVHNSYIVPVNKITAAQKNQLFVGKIPIPIGEKYHELFLRAYRGA